MRYAVRESRKFIKALEKLHPKDQLRIQLATSFLGDDPYLGKKLHGKFSEYYSLRVWPYRVVYKISKDEIIVYLENVQHRKDIYR